LSRFTIIRSQLARENRFEDCKRRQFNSTISAATFEICCLASVTPFGKSDDVMEDGEIGRRNNRVLGRIFASAELTKMDHGDERSWADERGTQLVGV
jgi:hypothetical protein